MIRTRYIATALLGAGLGLASMTSALAQFNNNMTGMPEQATRPDYKKNNNEAASAPQQDAARPEVAGPLQEAQALAKTGKAQEALAKIAQADAVPNKTEYEAFVIEQYRGPIAAAAGDNKTAIQSFEKLLASGKLPAAEKVRFEGLLAKLYLQQKDTAHAQAMAAAYLKDGGTQPEMRLLLGQTAYLNNDCATAVPALDEVIKAEQGAGKAPTEQSLQMVLNCHVKQHDGGGAKATLEQLVTYYPKKEYWNNLLNSLFQKKDFPEYLLLDGYRLKQATAGFSQARDYTDSSELAMRAGFPAEAKKFLEQGFQAGVLGKGPDAAKEKQQLAAATKSAAEDSRTLAQGEADARKHKDGTALVNLGYAFVTNGQYDKGTALMEQGIKQGGLKHPDEAKLHLALGYIQGGKKAQALETLKPINGNNAVGEMAHFWTLYLQHGA